MDDAKDGANGESADPPRHAVLIERWHAGDLDEAGRAELAALLGQSVEARAAWWEATQLSAQLRDVLRESAGARSGARLRPAVRPRRRHARRLAWSAWPMLVPLAIAAALAVVIGVWWSAQGKPPPTPGPIVVTPSPIAPLPVPPVAPTIAPASADLPILAAGGLRGADGVAVAVGSPLAVAGTAESAVVLRWADGRMVRLAPGSRISPTPSGQATDTAALRLESGEATAIAPPGATMRVALGAAAAAPAASVVNVVDGEQFTVRRDAGGTVIRADLGPVLYSVRGQAAQTVAAGDVLALSPTGAIAGRVIHVGTAAAAPGDMTVPTLAAACAAARPGDRIVLAPGIHRDGGDEQALARLRLRAPATAPLVITAEPGAVIEVTGWNGLVIEGSSNVIVRGLSFRGAGGNGGNGLAIIKSTAIRVDGCTFDGLGGSGINIDGGGELTIDDCTVTGNGGLSHFGQGGIDVQHVDAMPTADGRPNLLIRHCRVTGNRAGPDNAFSTTGRLGGHGLALFGPDERLDFGPDVPTPPPSLPGIVIVGNRLTGNDGCGVWLLRQPGALVAHNTLSDNMGLRAVDELADCTIDGCAGVLLLNNLIIARPDRQAVAITTEGQPPRRVAGNVVIGGNGRAVPKGFARDGHAGDAGISLRDTPAATWVGDRDADGAAWADPPAAGAAQTPR